MHSPGLPQLGESKILVKINLNASAHRHIHLEKQPLVIAVLMGIFLAVGILQQTELVLAIPVAMAVRLPLVKWLALIRAMAIILIPKITHQLVLLVKLTLIVLEMADFQVARGIIFYLSVY